MYRIVVRAVQQCVRPGHLPLVAEPASIVPTLLDPFEVHGGAPAARLNLGRRPCDGVPRAVHARPFWGGAGGFPLSLFLALF